MWILHQIITIFFAISVGEENPKLLQELVSTVLSLRKEVNDLQTAMARLEMRMNLKQSLHSDQHSNNDNGLSISDIFQASGCGEIIEEFEQNNEITNLFETSSTENEPPELEEPVSDWKK